jgi:hypothetical protein
MSLLVATQITAVATAVLAAFAIVTAVLAGLAFSKQSAELRGQGKLLEIESARFHRESDDRRREQASKVSAWMMNDNGTYPVLGNTSDEPVYRCIVSIYDQPTGHKIAEYARVDVLPPNHRESLDWAQPSPAVNWPTVIPVDIAITFTDRNGLRWERGPDGQLRLGEPSDPQ